MSQYLLPIVPPIGGGNSDAAICLSFTLPTAMTIASVAALFAANAGTEVAINIAYGTAALNGSVPSEGAIATPGQQLFASDQVLATTAGVNNILAVPAPAVWPAGATLTVRVVTGSGGCVGLTLVLDDGETATESNISILFPTQNIGAGTTDADIVYYYALPVSITIETVEALFTASAATSVAINLALGVAALTGNVPAAGATAIDGQQVFASDQVLSTTPGVTNTFVAPQPTAVWPAGLVLTLRAAVAGGAVSGLAITLVASGTGGVSPVTGEGISALLLTAVGPNGIPSDSFLVLACGLSGTITAILLNPPTGAGIITAVSNNPLVQVSGGGTVSPATFTITAPKLSGNSFNTSALITFAIDGDTADSNVGMPVLVYIADAAVQTGRSAAQAVATVRRRTNLQFGEPSDADVVAMLNDGIEEVARSFEPLISSTSLLVTAPNTNFLVLPIDVERIRDANYSTGNPALGGTVQYELVQLDYDSFIQETDSTPAGGIGGIPTIYTIVQDSSGVMVVQFYPYCNSGQFNFHYYKRPVLYTTLTDTSGNIVANPNSFTDLDSLWQGAVLLFACMEACENREDLTTGAAYFKKLFDQTMEHNMLEVKRRVRKRGTNTVRDVSVGESVVPTWLR